MPQLSNLLRTWNVSIKRFYSPKHNSLKTQKLERITVFDGRLKDRAPCFLRAFSTKGCHHGNIGTWKCLWVLRFDGAPWVACGDSVSCVSTLQPSISALANGCHFLIQVVQPSLLVLNSRHLFSCRFGSAWAEKTDYQVCLQLLVKQRREAGSQDVRPPTLEEGCLELITQQLSALISFQTAPLRCFTEGLISLESCSANPYCVISMGLLILNRLARFCPSSITSHFYLHHTASTTP